MKRCVKTFYHVNQKSVFIVTDVESAIPLSDTKQVGEKMQAGHGNAHTTYAAELRRRCLRLQHFWR